MNKTIGIYGFFVGDVCYYVGQSRNIAQRKYKHYHLLKKGEHENDRLQKSYNKYHTSMQFRIIEELLDTNKLTDREIYWIKCLNPKCNYMIPTVENWTLSTEARAKISAKVSGEKNGMFGKQSWCKGLSKKTNPTVAQIARKLSEQKKGIQPKQFRGIMNDEIRAKISKSHRGQKPSLEARRKMSEARRGKPIPWLKGRPSWNKGKKFPGSCPAISIYKKAHPTPRDPITGRFISKNNTINNQNLEDEE